MKHTLKVTVGLLVLCTLAVPSGSVDAQTTANGPYYATPSWDQKLQCDTQATCPRFIVLSNWNGEAALDRETGLVWQRSPLTGAGVGGNDPVTWSFARILCAGVPAGRRNGWRLPSIQELATLVDPDATSGPFLPAGHPFMNVLSATYWSATTDANDPTVAWTLAFNAGSVTQNGKAFAFHVWCVRGGGVLVSY